MKLADLAVDHPYYCSAHYTSENYDSFKDFLEDSMGSDEDYNLVFRWDIKLTDPDLEHSDDNPYTMDIFTVLQRKGTVGQMSIDRLTEEDVPAVIDYLTRKKAYLDKLWDSNQIKS